MRNNIYVSLLLKIALVATLAVLWWTNPFVHLQWAPLLFKLLGFLLFASGLNLSLSLVMLLYRRRKNISYGMHDNITSGVNNIYLLIIGLSLIFLLLSLWGIDFKTLFTSLSIVAAAIAIVSREFISAILAGFAIVFSKQINIGDYVQIAEMRGRVIDLTLTKLALLNEDDDLIFIANDKAYHSEIINFTKGDVKRVSIPFELAVSFKGTVEELEKDLILQLEVYKEDIFPHSFQLRIVEIHKDSISFKFQYTIDKINRDLEKEVKKKTVRAVLNYVKTKAVESNES